MSVGKAIPLFMLSHVCRQGNTIAHALAQRARHCSPISVWLDSYPMDISSFVTADFQP